MSTDDCFAKGLLRRVRPDRLKVDFSLKVADKKLAEAQKLFDAGFEDMALVSAYSAMFHAGRAILFRDGVMEKSHVCLIDYLKENYVPSGKLPHGLIFSMDAFRGERHQVLYGLDPTPPPSSDVRSALDTARQLVAWAKKQAGSAPKGI